MNIQISNLHQNTTESDLRRLFTPFGEINGIMLVRDKLNHRPSGRAYLEMPNPVQRERAITELHRSKLLGKSLTVIQVSSEDELAHRTSNF